MSESKRWSTILAVAAIICIGLCSAAFAEKPILWGDLEPGPYGVGFETIEKFDNSRVSKPKMNYFGELQEGKRARPIQICIWYPAVKSDDDAPMVYGEYAFPYPEDDAFFDFLSNLKFAFFLLAF